ncbi:glutathione-regulated potassium-efflux system ancillary protein KefF [Paucibacter oligotrophus]|uniref:Glutathione-regulated potassium-efflux system ancillary protein KefF n=1 Tax=Roseateles oligotrophus TaxID=1769250 RepID=A0A840LAC3_9BURK|nr:NAD(P)H-dependent oxidoreductase [Roseateles oligotrophus]MBB4843612.1 glutathione-regulated potassium-efflux system ancillary protein KefF [Roseateles oligotrophus]
MSEILILQAHPDLARSRVTRALAEAVRAATSPRIDLRDLYQRYPDYALDLEAEQSALAQARLIVLLHPLHWYGMPALLKLWVDEVLSFGWAYGPGGLALAGKDLWLASSTGGSEEDYSAAGRHGHAVETFLLPYAQIARLCGMRHLPPLLLHAAHRVSDAALHQHALSFVQRLLAYPQWCDSTQAEASQPPIELPVDARPAPSAPPTPVKTRSN